MNSQSFADKMLQRVNKEVREINEQREEILRAHIAKYGFDVGNTIQVECKENGARSWQVIHISDKDVAKVRKTLLISRISKEPLSRWQKCCVFLANGKWPK